MPITMNPKLLYIRDVEQIINKNRLTLRRWWKAGKFPKPTLLNGTALAWSTTTIEKWIQQNLQGSKDNDNCKEN